MSMVVANTMKKLKHLFPAGSGLAILLVALALATACNRKEAMIEESFKGSKSPYLLYVSKKHFAVEVYDRSGRMLTRYPVCYGENPDRGPKLHDGDNRTPEGTYRINEILSMDADKDSPAYRQLRAMNKVYFSARHGHHRWGLPDVDLGDNAYGPRYYGINYPNGEDWKRYRQALRRGLIPGTKKGEARGIGLGIALHGNSDEKSIGHIASSGCVRLFNNDIIELEQYVQIGTPVIISND